MKHGPDGKSKTVAHFHLADRIKGTPPSLEVDEIALPALDLIVITWIFMDQRRDGMPWRPWFRPFWKGKRVIRDEEPLDEEELRGSQCNWRSEHSDTH